MRPVLRTVVKIQALRRSVFYNGFVQGVFHNGFCHVGIEFTVEDHARGVVNQAGEIRRRGKAIDFQRRAVLNVTLPQIVPVQTLEALGAVGGVPVDLHHPCGIALSLERILQGCSLQEPRRDLSFHLQDVNDGWNAAAWKLPAQLNGRLHNVRRNLVPCFRVLPLRQQTVESFVVVGMEVTVQRSLGKAACFRNLIPEFADGFLVEARGQQGRNDCHPCLRCFVCFLAVLHFAHVVQLLSVCLTYTQYSRPLSA